MSSETEGYNGWKNYETWAVGMYLDGNYTSSDTYGDAIEVVQESLGGQHERYDVKEALKELVESDLEFIGDATLAADLLGAALSEVDWYELADAWIQNVKEMIELEQA